MSHDEEKYEGYLKESRKDGKMERKRASARDRSQYKKTDHAKHVEGWKKEHEAKLSKQTWLEGRVLSIMPQGIIVDWEGKQISCVLKGLLKRDKTLSKNLVAVGDFVLFEKSSEQEGQIAQIKPRKSILSRADNLSRRKEQVIAANIDQVLITVSVVNPPIKPFLVDRYIIATRKGNMDPIIVVNKVDLLNSKEFDPVVVETENIIYEEFLKAYSLAGIPVISVSATSHEGLEALRQAMHNKASVFSGQSGVGKSSLINALTGMNFKIGSIVEKTKKGAHTTSTTQLIPLEFGGWCIDTPGIKSFGVWDLKQEDIERYFSEIYECGTHCKFADCSHSHEEDCAVIQALEREEISEMRYESYLALLETVKNKHLRR